jgi:hypothetical protein
VTSWAPPSRALSAILVPIVVLIVFPRFAGTAEAASAVPVLVSLDYATDPALADCPSAADFSQSVIRQLGHDPFRPSAPRHLVVRLSAKGGRLAGLVEWRDAADQWEGERTFSSRNETCAQLVRTMALATAVQIQLLARLQEMGGEAETPSEAEVKPPVEAPPKPQSPPPLPPPPPPASTEPTIAVDVGVGVLQDAGDSPALVLPRIAIGVSLRRLAGLDVRVALSGLGPGAEVTRPEGVARIDRFIVNVALVRFFRSGRIVQPLFALGAGAQDIRARGTSAMPEVAPAHAGHAICALASLGSGVAFAFGARLAAVVEVEALLFRPSVTVEVGSTQAAHMNGAALFAHGGLLARF